MRKRNRIAVVGAGLCGPETEDLARELGRKLAEEEFVIVCGGLGGVMRSVCEGAKSAGGTTIGILPGEDIGAANRFVDIPIATNLGHMRNYVVVNNGDLVIAVEGGPGTLSELALALKSGKQVIALGRWAEIPGVHSAESVDEAVSMARTALAAEL